MKNRKTRIRYSREIAEAILLPWSYREQLSRRAGFESLPLSQRVGFGSRLGAGRTVQLLDEDGPVDRHRHRLPHLEIAEERVLGAWGAAELFEATGTWTVVFYGSAALAFTAGLLAWALMAVPLPSKQTQIAPAAVAVKSVES